MPCRREDAAYLRRQAIQLRTGALALEGDQEEVAYKLHRLAEEFDAYSLQMEQRHEPAKVR